MANLNDYPRHSLVKALRIPKGIMEQNAGKICTDEEAATYSGVKYNRGPIATEISSAIKYGLLSRPTKGNLELTEVAKKIIKPQIETDFKEGIQKAFFNSPGFGDVYSHYRG